jgi:hypothetical protein
VPKCGNVQFSYYYENYREIVYCLILNGFLNAFAGFKCQGKLEKDFIMQQRIYNKSVIKFFPLFASVAFKSKRA